MLELSQSVRLAWKTAAKEAGAGNSSKIEPTHFLIGICKLCDLVSYDFFDAPDAAELDAEVKADVEKLQNRFGHASLDQVRFRRRLRTLAAVPDRGVAVSRTATIHRSQASHDVFERANDLALGVSAKQLQLFHLLHALLEIDDAPWAGLLEEMGIDDPIKQLCDPMPATSRALQAVAAHKPTPQLDEHCRDMTRAAIQEELGTVIGRKDEMRSLARILSQKRKGNALLVGDAGVGKTRIVEGLVQRLTGANAPEVLAGKRFIELIPSRLVEGTKYSSEVEERMQAVLKEAAAANEHVVLFIDDIHMMLGGGRWSSDVSAILKAELARGEVTCIGATTVMEYRNHIEKNSSLERRFQVLWVEEPTREEATEILSGLRPELEKHHCVAISDDAIKASIDLSVRYMPDKRLPDKALDLLDQACASNRIVTLSGSSNQSKPVETIEREHIAAIVSLRCKIPVESLTEDEAQKLLRMEDVLRKRVIGQDQATKEVAEGIKTARAGLKAPNKPIGVFLFAGPTGTGKTELAKALAQFLFDNEDRMVRIDMSEYMEKHSVSRLIGSPPGYIGHEEGGQLTDPVRSNPYTVVLFDEIEKAHPEIMDIFLQIFDEGRLTDAKGVRVSFSETVIILTTNLGSAGRTVGFLGAGADGKGALEANRRRVMDALKLEMRPELINRIQRIVVFDPLNAVSIRRIVDKILAGVESRLESRKIKLELTDAAYDFLMKAGFNPDYGAREMERAVDRHLVQPLGTELLSGRVTDGSIVRVDANDKELTLTKS